MRPRKTGGATTMGCVVYQLLSLLSLSLFFYVIDREFYVTWNFRFSRCHYSSGRRQNLHFCARESWFMRPILHVPAPWNVLLRSSGYNMKTQSSLLPRAIVRVTAFLLPFSSSSYLFYTRNMCRTIFTIFRLLSIFGSPLASFLFRSLSNPRIDFYPSFAKSSSGPCPDQKAFPVYTRSRLQQNGKTFH